MRKGLLFAGLVALAGMIFTVAACNQPTSSKKYTVEISNKTDLQAGEWYPDSNGRKIEVNISLNDEVQNPTKAMQDGDLKFTSSNTEVATVKGQMVTPVGVGKTTIEAVYGDKKDSVEVEVVKKPTNKDRFGTDHEGTLEDPFTNEDALKAAKFIEENGGFDAVQYYFKGEIDAFYHAPGSRGSQCSWYMKAAAEKGERFEIYLCEKADKADWVRTDLWKGAVVTAHGAFTKYNKQYETTSAVLDAVEGTKPADPVNINATVAEALAAGKALGDGDSSWDDYTVTGYVVKKAGSDFFMSDAADDVKEDAKDMLELYGMKDETVLAGLLKNAKVKVKMQLKNYHGQVENGSSVAAADFEVLQAGGQWDVQKLTVAEAVAKIKAVPTPVEADFDSSKTNPTLGKSVEDGKTFAVTGYVVKKGKTWTDESQYKNADFYIADSLEEGAEQLQVFRYADKAIFDSLEVGKSYVEVTCSLTAFFKLNSETKEITLQAKETNQNPQVKVVDAPVPVTSNVTITAANLLGWTSEGGNVNYGDGEKTVDGLAISYIELGCYGNGIQMRTKNSKTSTFFNTSEVDIGSLVFTWDAGKEPGTTYSEKPVTQHIFVEFSNSADFSTLVGEKVGVLFDSTKTATVTPTAAAKYFRISHANQGGVYLASVVVNVAE